MHPKTDGILESSLYVSDVAHSAEFYEKIFGFRVISDFGERGCAMEGGKLQVLLLFKKGGSRDNEIAARRRRRAASCVRDSHRGFGELGSLVGRKRNRTGRKARLGIGRHKPLFS